MKYLIVIGALAFVALIAFGSYKVLSDQELAAWLSRPVSDLKFCDLLVLAVVVGVLS